LPGVNYDSAASNPNFHVRTAGILDITSRDPMPGGRRHFRC